MVIKIIEPAPLEVTREEYDYFLKLWNDSEVKVGTLEEFIRGRLYNHRMNIQAQRNIQNYPGSYNNYPPQGWPWW